MVRIQGVSARDTMQISKLEGAEVRFPGAGVSAQSQFHGSEFVGLATRDCAVHAGRFLDNRDVPSSKTNVLMRCFLERALKCIMRAARGIKWVHVRMIVQWRR